MQEFNIITISVNDPSYRGLFKDIKPSIKNIYAIGEISLLNSTNSRVAIVGTRNPSAYGTDVTKILTEKLVRGGITTVSGLAYGIDSITHRATLEHGGKTIAVLPGSLTNVYPSAHSSLAREIINNGGLLLSERHPEDKPKKHYFIERNRIIAALSSLVIVTEATHKTGTRHTVNFATEQNTPVVMTPGNITSPQSGFTNQSISDGIQPITSPDHLIDILKLNNIPIGKINSAAEIAADNPLEHLIVSLVSQKALTSNELIKLSKLTPSQFNISITMLEIKGIVQNTSDNKWRLAK